MIPCAPGPSWLDLAHLVSLAFLLLPGTHHRERDEEEWPSGYPGVISSTMREGGVEEGISRVPDPPHPPMPSIAYLCEVILSFG